MNSPTEPSSTAAQVRSNTPFHAHPPGLMTLFFTEMWERFSYYGMRALLVLYMVATQERGGLGMSDGQATALYGLYTAAVYLACLPGGWIADRIIGPYKAVWLGGIVISAGHFVLALPGTHSFFAGLGLVVLGTGLLKPNISALVGSLYPPDSKARDAGFTLFYMGINLGATLGPLVCSALGERLHWHYGFAAAGVGMVFGLIQLALMGGHIRTLGSAPAHPLVWRPFHFIAISILIMAGIVLATLITRGSLKIDLSRLANHTTTLIVGIAIAYFYSSWTFMGLTPPEKRRMVVIAILFAAAALFWAGFEQAGSSFNLFAERHTQRLMDSLQWTIPAGWFQSLGPIFVITLAPLMAALWLRLARQGREPSLMTKFAWGLLLLALGFVVMSWGARSVTQGGQAAPTWLILTYLIHTLGELCLSPVGLSSVTQLAPKRMVGQMMGVWFLAASLGSLIAGLLAGQLVSGTSNMSTQFLQITLIPIIAGVTLLALGRSLLRWALRPD